MKKTGFKKCTAGILAVFMMMCTAGQTDFIYAAQNQMYENIVSEEDISNVDNAGNVPEAVPTGITRDSGSTDGVGDTEASPVEAQLQNGSAVIPSGSTLAEVKSLIGNALVANASEVDLQSLEWEYYCTGKSGILENDAWGSIEGFTSSKKVLWTNYTYTHPSLAENEDSDYQIRLAGTGNAVTLTKAAKLAASVTLNENCSVALVCKEDGTVDFDTVRQNIFNAAVATTTPAMSLNDVDIQYYATATTGSLGSVGKEWVSLEGGKSGLLTYPAISEGTQKIKIIYEGTETYAETSAETGITLTGLPEIQFNLKEGPYETAMVFSDDQSYDYDAVKKAIINTIIDTTVPVVSIDDITVEYNASLTGLTENYKPIASTSWTDGKAFGPGTWKIRFTWNGNSEYKGGSVTAEVTVTDNREASIVVCNEGVSLTYNMDASVMKQVLFDELIDWESSALPAKESLNVDDFTMEYYGTVLLTGNISGTSGWAPVEGESLLIGAYPVMGAGEQKVRISYNGNAQYRPSEQTESAVTVNKAKVSVKVSSASIFADESVPEGFVSTDPADTFDVYMIYAGVNSNISAGIYLDLPERYTNSTVLKVLDPVIEKIYGKSFTELMNEGVTVGELRELLNTQELLDLLESLNIDTGTFGQILEVINNLPSITDSIRIGFGTPDHAGLYLATAVTDNANYETGVGAGMLLAKMHSTGVKLNWNQTISNGKMTQAEAAEFDFGATLSYDGDVTVSQGSVHYLYSGLTSKWKIYSSTTTPPTQPGRYVVTVTTLGGNYQASPITRSFQITK